MFKKILALIPLCKMPLLTAGLLISGVANAATVNIIATGTVSLTDSTQFSIGEEVSWTIQYDDADTTAHLYHDGANFIAEGGLGDDVLDFIGTDDLTNDFADVLFDFGDIFTKLLDGDTRVTIGFDSYNQSIKQNDLYSYTSDGLKYFGFSEKFRAYNNVSGGTAKDLEFSSISYNVSVVPLPAALWLFGSALLGLAGIKRTQ